MSGSKDKAVELLMHYFELAGISPPSHGDFRSEMEEVVERIGDYVIERLDRRARKMADADDDLHDWIMDEIDPLGQG